MQRRFDVARKHWIAIFAIGLVVVLATFLLFRQDTPNASREIILAENASPLSTLTIIAHQKGFFRQAGVTVKVSRFTSGKLALDAMLGGAADIATVAETPIMFAGAAKQDFRVFGTIFLSGNACKAVVRRDRGISKPADLKGKKVATFAGTNAEFFTKRFLEVNGLTMADVTLINLPPTEMVIALTRGDIDAYLVWEPFIYNGKASLKENAQIFEVPGVYTTTFNLTAKPEFLRSRPREVAAFVEALRLAARFANDNPDEAIKLVGSYTNIPPETLKAVWKDYKFPVTLNERDLVRFLSEQAQWGIESGKVKPPAPDYRKFLDNSFVGTGGN